MNRTDVDEMSLAVQHNVAVVSVFDLQQEKQKAVGGHAADEVVTGLCRRKKTIENVKQVTIFPISTKQDQQKSVHLLEGKGGFISILIPEVIIHPKICLPA